MPDASAAPSRPGSKQDSPSPIIFSSPASAGPHNSVIVVNVTSDDEKEEDAAHAQHPDLNIDPDDAASGSLHWAHDSDRGSIGKGELMYSRTEEEETGEYVFPPYPRIRRVASGREYTFTRRVSLNRR